MKLEGEKMNKNKLVMAGLSVMLAVALTGPPAWAGFTNLYSGISGIETPPDGIHTPLVGQSFIPPDADVGDLDHSKYYTWRVNLGFKSADWTITQAELTFSNIYDWTNETNDTLKVHLLNTTPTSGLQTKSDNQSPSDAFAGQGIKLGTWSDTIDTNPWKANPQTVTFVLSGAALAVLNNYASDGVIGFGFDPDCHYYNDGVKFTVTKVPTVPAPGALLLGSMGMGLVGWLRRRNTV
jgi:hypothetical protein